MTTRDTSSSVFSDPPAPPDPLRWLEKLEELAKRVTCSEVHEGTLCQRCREDGVGCLRAWAINRQWPFGCRIPPSEAAIEAVRAPCQQRTDFIDVCGRQQEGIDAQRREQMEQIPTIGRIVHYRLSADDVGQINRRRTTGKSIAERMKWSVVGKHDETIPAHSDDGSVRAWPAGAQAHIGNEAKEGDTVPMLIVKTWGDTPTSSVNGQAFLDGNDVLWVTSATVGEGPRTWSWPSRG